MIAVFSNWSKPSGFSGFNSKNDFIFSLALAVKYAKKIFNKIYFIGDKQSVSDIKIIQDIIGFDYISDELEILEKKRISAQLWIYPKLYVYSIINQPFIHIDNDVYLWETLPFSFLNSPLFCQGWDKYPFYRYLVILNKKGFIGNPDWEKARKENTIDKIPNLGICGGQNFLWLNQFAQEAIKIIESPQNIKVLRENKFENEFILIPEEWYFMVCANRDNIPIRTLVNNEDKYDIKYTHLLAYSKRNPKVLSKLYDKCEKEIPELATQIKIHRENSL